MANGNQTALIEDIGGFFFKPLAFVQYAYPWGEGALAGAPGPDAWQTEILKDIEASLRSGERIQIAISSGHGIGKTTLVAWIIHWFMSTREHPQIICTANTATQLNTKTWRELAKWHGLSLHANWFNWSATKFSHALFPQTWFAAAIPWSVTRTESFAGAHETHVLLIFDEASAIDDQIWAVSEGALTSPGAMWMVFGNPTRNTGRFRECFGKFRHRWQCHQIDSRTTKLADKVKVAQWIEDYGEDSDFVRVRVRGVFPRASSNQWIGHDLIETARKRDPAGYEHSARIIGVDVARHGDDQTVILRRQGPMVWPPRRLRTMDLMAVASLVAEEIAAFDAHACFIDATGIGWGVYDRLVQLHHRGLHSVQTGETANDPSRFYNLRMELWDRMRAWIKAGGHLPDDQELMDDLIGPEYGFDAKERLQLERKADMKSRGLSSCDSADALALTFAAMVLAPQPVERPAKLHRGPESWMGGG